MSLYGIYGSHSVEACPVNNLVNAKKLMKSFIKFNLGLLKSPLRVRLWLILLVAANLAAPMFFLERAEARVVLAAMAASMALMTILTGQVGFTRLLGAGHVFWVPLIGWLWSRLDQIPANDAFGLIAGKVVLLPWAEG